MVYLVREARLSLQPIPFYLYKKKLNQKSWTMLMLDASYPLFFFYKEFHSYFTWHWTCTSASMRSSLCKYGYINHVASKNIGQNKKINKKPQSPIFNFIHGRRNNETPPFPGWKGHCVSKMDSDFKVPQVWEEEKRKWRDFSWLLSHLILHERVRGDFKAVSFYIQW